MWKNNVMESSYSRLDYRGKKRKLIQSISSELFVKGAIYITFVNGPSHMNITQECYHHVSINSGPNILVSGFESYMHGFGSEFKYLPNPKIDFILAILVSDQIIRYSFATLHTYTTYASSSLMTFAGDWFLVTHPYGIVEERFIYIYIYLPICTTTKGGKVDRKFWIISDLTSGWRWNHCQILNWMVTI